LGKRIAPLVEFLQAKIHVKQSVEHGGGSFRGGIDVFAAFNNNAAILS
jgi:hypothetical protein